MAGWQLLGPAAFLAIVTQRVVQLWVRQGRVAVRAGLREGALPAVLLLITNAWVLLVLARTIPLPVAPLQRTLGEPRLYAPPLAWTGALLAVLAFALFVAAMRDLGASWRLGIDADHPGRLVTTGAYRLSRNPTYLFFDLCFLGTLLMNGNPVFLLILALMVAGLHAQIRL
ncbi:MAG: methyltransferase, partial [Chloroflexota bacterium]